MESRVSPQASDGAPAADGTAARLRQQYLESHFDPAYVDNVIVPFLSSKTYKGERLSLPMIDVAYSKDNAMAPHLWGMLSDTWKPCPEQGVTVFLQGLDKRGPGNRRKKIYMTALTP